MKTTIIIIAGIICISVIAAVYGFSNKKEQTMLTYSNNTFDKEWQEIDSLERNGLPKSALEKTEDLYKKAVKRNNPAQIIKTILYRGKYMNQLEEYGLENAIAKFEEEAAKASFPAKPVLLSMQAEMYTNYLAQNRYKFNNRTQTVDFESGDIKTWTIEQINQKAVQLYLESLKNKESQRVPLTDFKAITTEYNSQELYPTLFDFLTKRAVDFFNNSQTYLTQPAYQFYVDQAEAFAPSKDFINHTFTTKDENSLKFLNLLRFQEWLKFHIDDDKQDALIYIDLLRLDFVNRHSIHPEKETLYKTALQALKKKHAGHPASAGIAHKIAYIHYTKGTQYQPSPEDKHKYELKTAIEICREAYKQFPKTAGGISCQNLILQIEQPSLKFTLEKIQPVDKPILVKLDYKNVETAYFKLYKIEQEQFERNAYFVPNPDIKDFDKNYDQVKTWEEKLPDDGDYQNHAIELQLPPLKNGIYYLVASSSRDFKELVTVTHTYVSNISFITTNVHGGLHFLLTDRITGQPLKDVKAEAFSREYNARTRSYDWKPAGNFTSDNDGRMITNVGKSFKIKFNHKEDELYLNDNFYSNHYNQRNQNSRLTTTFFTDRAIYRPGQTVYFKGIVLNTDGNTRMPSIKANYPTTVTFYDVNYQKIEDIKVKTNEYGTYSGSFTAPTSGLLGHMTIQDNSTSSRHNLRVEEYKRPKFEVEFLPVKESYKLNDEVTAKGQAKAYAGSNIDGAKVSYRVVRQTRFPYWSWWRWGWYNPWQRDDMEITNGYAETDDKGEFEIKFQAIPDKSIPKDKKPQFVYKVIADVIDITGETHSSETYITVGYIALNADISIAEKNNIDSLDKFPISTKNLNGEFEPATGTVKVSRLLMPDIAYKKRLWPAPDKQIIDEAAFKKTFPLFAYKDEDKMANWKKGAVLFTDNFNTANEKFLAIKNKKWEPGSYELVLNTKDKYGEPIEIIKYFTVFNPKASSITTMDHIWHYTKQAKAEPGETHKFSFGSVDKNTYFLYEVSHKGEIITQEWIKSDKIIHKEIRIEEKHRGNLFYKISLVKNNRAYLQSYTIYVPWSNKELKFEYATFRDKLLPGAKEQWKIKLIGPKGEKVAAEMLAGMYDASLDAFAKNNWNAPGYPSNYNSSSYSQYNAFAASASSSIVNAQQNYQGNPPYKSFPSLNWFGFNFYNYSTFGYYNRRSRAGGVMPEATVAAPMMKMEAEKSMDAMTNIMDMEITEESMASGAALAMSAEGAPPPPPPPSPDMPEEDFGDVKVRTNLNETVFFFPDLETDEQGNVIISFTMNEALTRWNFMGFAHTKDYKYGFTNKEVVTQKDLMVMPNPPRFLRESDVIHFTAKVSNLSEKDLTGTAKLELYDAITMKPIDAKLSNTKASIPFTAKQGQSAPLSWKLTIPNGTQAVTYRVVAKAGNFSDGEENTLPVLTNRMMVTETMPLPVRGLQTKKFTFDAMKKSGESSTLSHHKMTLEFTENPAWYAIQALPYMMEYPYECTEQIFARYYANSLASTIANSQPKIRKVFDSWKGTDAMLSNLTKNQELKTALLEETPWVLQAQSEEQQKRNIGLLFDLNRMAQQEKKALKTIVDRQLSNGGFAWFPGGRDNWYITQHIVASLGHLDRLGVRKIKEDGDMQAVLSKAINYIDDRIAEHYQKLLDRVAKGKADLKNDNLGGMPLHYLYARTFFMDNPVKGQAKVAMDYYVGQAEEYWLNKGMYYEGFIALSLHRMGKEETPQKIVRSLKERSLNNDEMGMYWKYNTGYYWYQMPIETHALMIEVFDEVANDAQAVDDLKTWLLKNKQTTHWKTTKATAAAVYAMLMRGDNWLVEDKPVVIKFSGKTLDQSNIKKDAGSGYFKTSWDGDEVDQRFSEVEVKNQNKVVAWGALYWQYFENLDKIKTFEDTPLTLKKQVFLEENSATGPQLRPVSKAAKLEPGNKLVVRIELRVDRDMEYVHMKDMRASGLEPMNTVSQYKWQGGLGYYESTRDAATNFFFSWLPKGTYVFEYPLRVNHKGDFSNGITTIQSMYAPEFTSHSEGVRLIVE